MKKTRPPFSRITLEPTDETIVQERGEGVMINALSSFEARLRPQGYPVDPFLAGLTIGQLQRWSANPDRTTHYGLPLVLRDPSLIECVPRSELHTRSVPLEPPESWGPGHVLTTSPYRPE